MPIINRKPFNKLSSKEVVKKHTLLFKKIPLIRIVYASISLAFINILIVIIVKNNLPPEVPLFYGLVKGPEQLTSSLGLIIPGVISLIITTLTVCLVIFLNNKFLQQTLILSSFAVSVFSIITTIKIILLVGSF